MQVLSLSSFAFPYMRFYSLPITHVLFKCPHNKQPVFPNAQAPSPGFAPAAPALSLSSLFSDSHWPALSLTSLAAGFSYHVKPPNLYSSVKYFNFDKTVCSNGKQVKTFPWWLYMETMVMEQGIWYEWNSTISKYLCSIWPERSLRVIQSELRQSQALKFPSSLNTIYVLWSCLVSFLQLQVMLRLPHLENTFSN